MILLSIGIIFLAFSFAGSLMNTQTAKYNKRKEEQKQKDAFLNALKTYGTGKH